MTCGHRPQVSGSQQPGGQYAAAGHRVPLPRGATHRLRQGGEFEYDRQHQGSYGLVHPSPGRTPAGVLRLAPPSPRPPAAIPGSRLRRWPCIGPPCHDLHARVDEPGAQGSHSEPGRHDPAGEPRRGGIPGQHQDGGGVCDHHSGRVLSRTVRQRGQLAAHAETTGPEIWWQLRFHGLSPDAFVAGVGTGGTVMGVGNFLRRMKPEP